MKNLDYYQLKAAHSLGVSYDILKRITIRASRMKLADIPDGAKEYQPLTKEYEDSKFLGPHTLRRLLRSEKRDE